LSRHGHVLQLAWPRTARRPHAHECCGKKASKLQWWWVIQLSQVSHASAMTLLYLHHQQATGRESGCTVFVLFSCGKAPAQRCAPLPSLAPGEACARGRYMQPATHSILNAGGTYLKLIKWARGQMHQFAARVGQNLAASMELMALGCPSSSLMNVKYTPCVQHRPSCCQLHRTSWHGLQAVGMPWEQARCSPPPLVLVLQRGSAPS